MLVRLKVADGIADFLHDRERFNSMLVRLKVVEAHKGIMNVRLHRFNSMLVRLKADVQADGCVRLRDVSIPCWFD